MPSIFSRIIAAEIPSFKVYEDEYVYAFLDINPISHGHTLIVPKTEIDYFVDVPEPYYSAVFQAAKKIAPALQKVTGCKRVSTIITGFDVPHFHYHLIPSNSGADIDFSLAKPADFTELGLLQERIISSF